MKLLSFAVLIFFSTLTYAERFEDKINREYGMKIACDAPFTGYFNVGECTDKALMNVALISSEDVAISKTKGRELMQCAETVKILTSTVKICKAVQHIKYTAYDKDGTAFFDHTMAYNPPQPVTTTHGFPSSLKGLYLVANNGDVLSFDTQRYIYSKDQSHTNRGIVRAYLSFEYPKNPKLRVEPELRSKQYQSLQRGNSRYKQCRQIFEYPTTYWYDKTHDGYWSFLVTRKICHAANIQHNNTTGTCTATHCTQWRTPDWTYPRDARSKIHIFSSKDKAIAFAKGL